MEFNEKLQLLRKERGITQEELAQKLYVSRTAISKWESGRGYPSIDSLKAIATFFSVTVDELISGGEAVIIAEADSERREKRFNDLVIGLVDSLSFLLLLLPLFAERSDGIVISVSLISLVTTNVLIKIISVISVVLLSLVGILTLLLQKNEFKAYEKIKTRISLFVGTELVTLFVLSLHPYAAIFAFALLLIKLIVLIKIR